MDYQHGGDIYGESRIRLDFSVNTNPFGMPVGIRNAVLASSEEWEQYPDCLCRRLRRRLADYYNGREGGWEADDFICGNGASDLFYTMALALRPRRAFLLAPAFGEYEKALRLAGCGTEWFFLDEKKGFSPEAEGGAFFSAVEKTEGLELVWLGNPNNPNGMAVSREWLARLAWLCRKKGAVLALDECFNWFLKERRQYSMMELLKTEPERYDHVIIFNAFTKIYSMPGLRMGYAASKGRRLLKRMEESRQPWSLSAPAEAAALAALKPKQQAYAERTAERIRALQKELGRGLERLGFTVYPSMANYLLFRKMDGVDYAAFLREHEILIRSCANYSGLGAGYYRTAVKREEENRALLDCLGKAVGGKLKERLQSKGTGAERDNIWQGRL